jgi:hypothetical protein
MAHAVEPIETGRASNDRWDRIGVWIRRGAMCLLAAFVVAALFNVFGQRASTQRATSSQAELELRAPGVTRPGLLFQARITITAKQMLTNVQLVLGRGWVDGLTMNTNEPIAASEASGPDGSLVFDLGALQPGQPWVQYLEFQVNPTSVSNRDQTLTVLSDEQPVVSLHRTMAIVP